MAIPAVGTPEWHAERRTAVGASEAAAVLGLSSWMSRQELWELKVGLRPPEPENARMRRGHLMEPVVAQMFGDRTGIPLRRDRRFRRHPRWPFVGAHIDRRGPDRLVEIKTTEWGHEWGEAGDPDGVPEEVRIQAQQEMAVWGFDRCDVVVLIGLDDLRITPLERDPILIEGLVDELATFWAFVERGEMPPFDEVDAQAASDWPRRRYRLGRDELELPPATAEQALIVDEFRTVREQRLALEKREDALKAQIQGLMGEATRFAGPGFSISWPAGEAKPVTDWEAVARMLGSQVERERFGAAVAIATTTKPAQRGSFRATFRGGR